MNLQGNNDNFIGTTKEENSEYSVPLEAKIKGFSENEFISFVKKYPKKPQLKEDGSTDIIIKNETLEIEHTGYIDSNFDSMYGSWLITEKMLLDHGYEEVTTYGIWMLKRIK